MDPSNTQPAFTTDNTIIHLLLCVTRDLARQPDNLSPMQKTIWTVFDAIGLQYSIQPAYRTLWAVHDHFECECVGVLSQIYTSGQVACVEIEVTTRYRRK
jgi:hypothetical protein